MKKIIGVAAFAVLGMVALSSCKKDYVCTCTDAGSTITIDINNVKKSTAESACAVYATGGATCSI
ncbi:MAG: hypothetical protein COA33_009960 [Fluviicola sp.]|nr:hypothetical protein [Fluviicola sp.]